MKTLRRLVIPIVMLIACIGFGSAFAQNAPIDPDTNPSGAFDQFWQLIVAKRYGVAAVIGTMLFVALVRFVAPRLHDKFGAWVCSTRVSAALAFLSGLLAAIATELLKGGKMSPQLLVYGFGFGVAAIGGYNAFWDLLFPTDKKQPAAGTTTSPPPPPITKASVLLPLAFALVLSGCGTLGKCLLNGLPKSLETLVADVFSIVYQQTSVVSDIESLGSTPDVACVVTAVEDYIQSKTKAHTALSAQQTHALQLLQEYLTKHPATACKPINVVETLRPNA